MSGDFYIGDWLVQAETGRVTRENRSVDLEPKAIAVLLCLVKQQDKVVSKERLLQAVWPDTFVTDDVLTHAISELRRAFEDNPKDPRVIQTLPRRGYRLIAPVTPVPEGQDRKQSRGLLLRSVPRWGLAAIAALALAGAVTWFSFFSLPENEPTHSYEPVPLTSYPGSELEPTFSPDGNQVAFSWNGMGEDNFDIYVKSIGSEETLRLTDNPAVDFSPAWSPDGRYIAFLRKGNEDISQLLLISPLGGAERKVAGVGIPELPGIRHMSPFLAWAHSGKWVAISQRSSLKLPCALHLVSVETGETRRLTSPPVEGFGDYGPSFSPDGNRLAFCRKSSVSTGELYLLSLGPALQPLGEPTRVTSLGRGTVAPAWTRDGRKLVFGLSRGFNMEINLWQIDLTTSAQPILLDSLGDEGSQPAIASGKPRLAFSRQTRDTNIWRLQRIDNGEMDGPVIFASSTRRDSNPQLSPDGKRIAFTSSRSGHSEIWVCDRDGSNLLRLTFFEGPFGGAPSWDPAGERIAFDMRVGDTADIYVVPSRGGPVRQLTRHPADDMVPTWSRDGKWVYFGSRRKGLAVWKIPSEGGEAIQVTSNGGIYGWESPDGSLFYYTTRQGPTYDTPLRSIDRRSGEETVLISSVSNYNNFAVVERGIYFIEPPDLAGQSRIMLFDTADGSTTTVATLDKLPLGGLTVSQDEKTILFGRLDVESSDLLLVENFH